LVRWFFSNYMHRGMYIPHHINGLGVIMNKWDKVEKNKRISTQDDITWLYIKTILFVLGSIAYFYFIIMGGTI